MEPDNSPAGVRRARLAAGMTQGEAAALVHLSRWQSWQEYETGKRPADPARLQLFRILTRQAGIPRFSPRRNTPPRAGRPPTVGQ